LARRKTAPAKVGGEGGGGRPRRPQCRRAGESTGQCVCTGASKGCGWRLSRRSNSSRGDEPRGAPASSGRRQWRAREAALSSDVQMRGRGRCVGRREDLRARMRARWLGRLVPGVRGEARGLAIGCERAGGRAVLQVRGCGPGHDDRRVVSP
jgi:hypothetical protein